MVNTGKKIRNQVLLRRNVLPPGRAPNGTRNLTHALTEVLSDSIHRSAIRPGDKLPSEAMIMAEYGVSRTVVREAITSLQAAGLIQTRHGIGSFVRAVPTCLEFRVDPASFLTLQDILAMLELRISLETEASAFAAARRTNAQIDKMRRALDAFTANLQNPPRTAEPDFQFHFQIASATGNHYFVEIMSHLGQNAIPRTRVDALKNLASQVEYLNIVSSEHENIFDAIVQRDPEGARAAMRAHLVSSRERLRRAQNLANVNKT